METREIPTNPYTATILCTRTPPRFRTLRDKTEHGLHFKTVTEPPEPQYGESQGPTLPCWGATKSVTTRPTGAHPVLLT